ncbi:hypothetical protein HYR99_04350 [Candidatus Poribacteria bacterium]|nr:hypothetical protein [Candidatus Poribacteria bacterium]
MSQRYTYVVTCIKETPIRWGIELESLGEVVPPKVVRFPHLTQPLTRPLYFQSGYDPMAYFKLLVKGVPEMLRGYNARILNQIQRRMNQLQVGGRCHVKISYIDNGEGVSPFNYALQLIEDPPLESRYILSQIANRKESNQPVPNTGELSVQPDGEIASDIQYLNASSDEEQVEHLRYKASEAVDPIELITELNQKIRQLQVDMERLKDWLVEVFQDMTVVEIDAAASTGAAPSHPERVAPVTQTVTNAGDPDIGAIQTKKRKRRKRET